MTARTEEQAFTDGRNAFREGKGLEKNPRRSVAGRAAWVRGYEHERGLDLAARITPEQRAEAERTKTALNNWAREFFGERFDIVNRQ